MYIYLKITVFFFSFLHLPDILLKITEPLNNILEQIFKRQQEIQRMIHGCNCARPTPEVNPFGNRLPINN